MVVKKSLKVKDKKSNGIFKAIQTDRPNFEVCVKKSVA
jgi:hypothetical protein